LPQELPEPLELLPESALPHWQEPLEPWRHTIP
jgi:hypothetical protein